MSLPLPLAISEMKKKQLALILSGNFPYGLRIGSMIDKYRFKACYTRQYGDALEQSDEEFMKILRAVGTLRDNRIFSKETSKAETEIVTKILMDITETFKAGAKCIYFSELFKKYNIALTSQLKIFSLNVFCKFLSAKLGGKYFFNKSCVYSVSEYGAFEEIYDFICSSWEPVTPQKIHKKLWYVPVEVIAKYLKSAKTKDFVKVDEGTYFYAFNFPVMPEELQQIQEIISDQLYMKDFITAEDLRELIDRDLPSVSMSIENFSTHAMFVCLSVLLKDKFSFSGSLISSLSQPLSADDVFREFCMKQDELTVDDIESFAEDFGSKSGIRWKAVSDVMLRVSEDKFINNKNFSFNVQEVDRAINEILGGSDYMPLQKMNLFINYPQCGHSWNKYLLESYAAKFSWEFMLLHSNYSQRNSARVIVRRDSGIKNFQMLIARVLASSDSWLTRDEALDFLVREGYLKSRRCSGIDKAMSEARLLRRKFPDKF